MPEPRTLLRQLLEYIGEQAKDIDPRSFRLSSAKGFIRRPEGIRGLPGVEFDIKVEGDHTWLRVARLIASKPIAVHEKAKPFIKVSDDPEGAEPSLDEAAFLHWLSKAAEGKTAEERNALEARGRSTLEKVLGEYIPLWRSWAQGERPRRATIALYGDLFALRHQLEAEETSKPQELAWGVGVALWRLKFEGATFDFEYPLLTQNIEIALDEESMALELRPRATDTHVELDALVACQIGGAAEVEKTAKQQLARARERPVTPFDPSSYADILKLAATNLDSKGSYLEILSKEKPTPAAGENLVVTDAWVIFSRRRSNSFLFEDLKRLEENLAEGCDIPDGPLSLVTPPSDQPVEFEDVRFRGISSRGTPDGGRKAEELFFPLPYNDEQVTIVQRLERSAGVCVQGPPGTGKTHTIANIICHYLATGRRVLVTSRGEPALEVLQQKLPEEVRSLTVALLAGDRAGVRQFQASIEAIQHKVSQLNPELTKQEIATLMSAIERAHTELSRIDKRVDEIAASQLSEVEVDGVPMRAQKLAEVVISGQRAHEWFDDAITLAQEHAPPISDEEAGRIREARRKLGHDLVYAGVRVPSADDLPAIALISQLHDVLSSINTIQAQLDDGQLLPLRANTPEVLDLARGLLKDLDQAIALVEDLEKFDGRWPFELRAKCLTSSFVSERSALEALFVELDRLIRARAEFLQRPVELPEAALSSTKSCQALAQAAETGKPFGFLSFGASEAKQHLGAVRVSGLSPATADDWAHVQRYAVLHEESLSFNVRWNQFAPDLSIPKLEGSVSDLRRIELTANAARKAHRLATCFDAVLPSRAEAVFDKPPSQDLLGRGAELNRVREQLRRHLTKAELSGSVTLLATIQEKLAGMSGPVSDALRSFIEGELGNPSVPSERVAARYAELIAELRRIAALATELAVIRDFSVRLERAGATKVASRVRTQPVGQSGEDRVFPATWRQAWNWARMRTHLENIESRAELRSLASRRAELEKGLSRLYKDVVAKAAWLSTKKNASPRVLQALAGYATAIRRIGQGTGPNATRYRRDAREAMFEAADAVPCWVMSHARVSESIPPEIGAFDLVIVDEASQSDLWALPAILRGKKILVVGDDKQVSPDAGFIAAQKIVALKQRFLADQPYGNEMTPEKPLYDLAGRVFAATQVMLREHFRCVPPIIAYSNRVFYKDQIQPIRIPKSSERIDPPLVDIYIPSGIRDRHDCNEAEAQAIAE